MYKQTQLNHLILPNCVIISFYPLQYFYDIHTFLVDGFSNPRNIMFWNELQCNSIFQYELFRISINIDFHVYEYVIILFFSEAIP